MDEKEFEGKLITEVTKRLIKEYDIQYNPEEIIIDDDAFTDRLFKAGLDFAIRSWQFPCASFLPRYMRSTTPGSYPVFRK